MERITSEHNQKIRRLILLGTKARERRKSQSFVIEGGRLVGDTPPESIQEVYVAQSWLDGQTPSADCGADVFPMGGRCIPQHDGKSHFDLSSAEGHQTSRDNIGWQQQFRNLEAAGRVTVLSDDLFAKVSNTQTPQGILAVVQEPRWEKKDLLLTEHSKELTRKELGGKEPATAVSAGDTGREDERDTETPASGDKAPLLLILENIQDPGNLGTMFRTAEAAGVTGIIMTSDCVDLFNPKTVRATMSSIFRVPFIFTEDILETIRELRQHDGIRTYAAYLDGARQYYYDEADYRGGTAFLVGNEGNGLRPETAAAADARILIPMEGRIESLNAAMSAGILLYEAHRQRRSGIMRTAAGAVYGTQGRFERMKKGGVQ